MDGVDCAWVIAPNDEKGGCESLPGHIDGHVDRFYEQGEGLRIAGNIKTG